MPSSKSKSDIKINLKKFDISKITDDKVVVLIGKRNTGKSFLVRDILYHHRNLPIGTVISGTEMANGFYSSILPKQFIHHEFNPSIVDNVIKRQKKLIKQIKKDKQHYNHSNIDPRLFFIMDDCLYDTSWARDENIRCIFMNGRHFKIFFIITMQFPLGVPPNLRTNIDYVFILRENTINNRKRIFDNYAGIFPNFDIFNQVMDQCTQNYECLVIDNTSKSNEINDVIYWYKASPHPDFKIGAPIFWQQQNDNDSDDDEGGSGFNPHDVSKNKYVVSVKKGI
jgi:hypothetical protein